MTVLAFRERLQAELADVRDRIRLNLVNGSPGTYDEYRFLVGQSIGLERAIATVGKVYTQMYETKDINTEKS